MNDNFLMGNCDAIYEAIKALQKCIQDCLSYKMKFSADKKKAWLEEKQLIERLERKFGEQVTKVQA